MTEPLSTNHLFISKLTKLVLANLENENFWVFSEYPNEDAYGPLVINYM